MLRARKHYRKFCDTADEPEPAIEEDSDKEFEELVYSDPVTEDEYRGSSDDEIKDLFNFETGSGNSTNPDNLWTWILL